MAKKPAITSIIFDLGEVLLNGLWIAHDHLAERFDCSKENSIAAFENAGLEDYFRGLFTEDIFLARVIARTGWNISVPELKRFIRSHFTAVPGTRQMVAKLRKQRFTLALLSDHGREWVEHCEQMHHYEQLYDCCMYSYEFGSVKARRWVFRRLLRRIKTTPAETLFIDDRPPNLEVADEVGLHTLCFTSVANLRRDLGSRFAIAV